MSPDQGTRPHLGTKTLALDTQASFNVLAGSFDGDLKRHVWFYYLQGAVRCR